MQWRGGGGSSSGANVMRNSSPHSEHRYLTLTLRNSPSGGGSGSGVVIERSMPVPTNHSTKNNPRAPSHNMNVENVGTT